MSRYYEYPVPLDDRYLAAWEAAEAERAANDARFFRRITAPLLAATVAVGGAYVYLEASTPAPRETTYSCTDFEDDVLKPPSQDQLGFARPGARLDPGQIGTDGMRPDLNWEKPDGSSVLAKPLGNIENRDGTLGGRLDMPRDYGRTVIAVFQNDGIRWGVCNLEGGVTLRATDTDAMVNGGYVRWNDSVELIFKAGGDDPLFDDSRDVAYVQSHEIGHSVRDEILKNGTDARSMELIERLDALYKRQLSMALEETGCSTPAKSPAIWRGCWSNSRLWTARSPTNIPS